jgi:Na+-driven multidrug efflux pump
MEKRDPEISELNIGPFFRKNMIGMIIAGMMGMLGIVVDGVITSRFLGTQCMAAYGLVTPVTNLAMVFSGVFSGGSQVVCAHLVGAGKNEEARRVFSMCMTATVVLSVCLMAVLFIWRSDICILLGASGENADLLPLASDYLLGVLFSVPSVIMLFEFNGLMRLDNDPNRIIVAVTVMTLLDIGGDFLNVLVIHGGMLGMGLSTSISYAVGLAIMLLHFRRKNIIFRYSPKGMKWKDLKDIIVIGSPSAVGSGSAMLRNRVLNGIMLQAAMAVAATAALSVLNTILNIISSIMGAMGLTCSMITGLVIGMKNEGMKKELMKVTVKNALVLAVILFAILFIFAPYIILLFEGPGGAEMTAIATRGLRIYSVGIFLFALNTAYINHAQGMRRMVVSNVFNFLENFVLIVIPALALSGVIGTDAVWAAYPIAEAITFVLIIIFRFVSKRRSD